MIQEYYAGLKGYARLAWVWMRVGRKDEVVELGWTGWRRRR
jgi:hypothetical protein